MSAEKKAKQEKQEKQEKHEKQVQPSLGPSLFAKKYLEVGVTELMNQFKYKNRMQCPRLKKIVVNTSIKEAMQDKKILEKAAGELAQITGQRPFLTKARKDISNFKLRAGQPIGCCVTLRRKKMYEFLNRLVNVVLPRVRDFRGVKPNAFDDKGNYTLGLTEQTIFPEIQHDKVDKVFGMNITLVTTAPSKEEGRALLKVLGMPFRE